MTPTDMRWIYISPHFDDAALSCGGLIFEQARRSQVVEIWTICAGDAPAGALSQLIEVNQFVWGTGSPEESVRVRTAEDETAARRLGAEICHFNIPDCIYRRDEEGALLYTQDVQVEPHPADAPLAAEISAALREELLPGDQVVCPLALGAHVDHVITRRAVEALGLKLRYYADIPYLFRERAALAAATAGLKASRSRITRQGLIAWQDGIAAYASQMRMLFESEALMRQAVESYWAANKALTLWFYLPLRLAWRLHSNWNHV